MKACNTCGVAKPISDFYQGVPRCKECHKAAMKLRHHTKIQDVVWREKEAERHRIKSRKARLEGRVASKEAQARARRNWEERYPEKKAASTAVANAIRCGRLVQQPCEVCGELKVDAHHDDYSKPLDVRWLCRRHHAEHHLSVNIQKRMEKFMRSRLHSLPMGLSPTKDG